MSLPLTYILFTQNTFYTCYDANPEPSTYKFETILELPGNKHIKFATEFNIFDCPVGCLGCYQAQNIGSCIECTSLTRSYSRFPTVAEIINRGIFNCGCSSGLVEVNKADCECPSGQYMVSSSPSGPFVCYGCRFNYKTCSLDPVTGCQTGMGRNWDIQTLCSCEIGYREYAAPGNNCEQYCMLPCTACKPGTSQQCLTCNDPLMILNFVTSQCECPNFWFMNIDYLCYSCQYSCQTCNTLDSCLTCNPLDQRIIGASGFCECQSGYLEDPGSSQCRSCHINCLTCGSQYDVCESCMPSSFRNLVGYQCLCKDSYYDNGKVICEQCPHLCKYCRGPLPTDCLGCDADKFLVLIANQCICKKGYGFTDNTNQVCSVCNSVCQTCSQVNVCTSCFQNSNRYLNEQGLCQCDDGFYDMNQNCQRCHFSCKSCDILNPITCLSCYNDDGRILTNGNSCTCMQGYFELSQSCIQCHYSCQTCQNQFIDGCLTCPISRELVNNQCLCKQENQIDDGSNPLCVSCHFTCQKCNETQSNNCLSCFQNSLVNRFLQYGTCTCPTKWFEDGVNEQCQQCHLSCQNCMNPSRNGCVSCSKLDYRQQFSNSCLCFNGYYENQQTLLCQSCSYKCMTCNLDESNCLTCPLRSFRQLVQQQTYSSCECIKTMPRDVIGNPTCQRINFIYPACHFSCANCSDYEYCTQCDENQNRELYLDSNGSHCKCKASYYDVGTSECAECSPNCQTCINSENNCTSCNQNQFRTLNGNQCICAIRFGEQYLSYYDVDNECVECHYSCYTCYGSQYNECLTCSDQDNRYLQGSECQCKPKYIDDGVGVCLQCNYNCENCFGNKSYCTSCQADSLRILDGLSQSCDCPNGYFDSGEAKCECNLFKQFKQECDIKCEMCNLDASSCLSCKFGANRLYNIMSLKCDCLYGYYDAGDGYCKICHFSCLQCEGPTTYECTQCSDYLTTYRVFISNQCLCSDGYYDDQQTQICKPCSSTCLTCQNDKNFCTQCNLGQNRVLDRSSCNCKEQYFDTGSLVCSQCSPYCLNCINNPNQCTKCDINLNRYLKQQKCDCQQGFYDDGQLQCQSCNYSCKTCSNSSSFCTSCEQTNFRVLINNQCVCQQGTIDDGQQQCKNCNIRCQTCSNILADCLSCNQDLFRILVGKQCQCRNGYYENSILQCQQCSSSCKNCQFTQDNCISCDVSLNRILVSSQCVCQNGYYQDQFNNCQICSNQCLLCEGQASNCTSCKMERILANNKCQCLDGLYDNQNQCLKCSYSCQQCKGNASFCISCSALSKRQLSNNQCDCIQGYYDIGSLICLQCSYRCETCINQSNYCLTCEINRFLSNNDCECQQGYYDDGQDCSICSPQCKTCFGQANKCSTCDTQNFREDQSLTFNKCPCMIGFYDDSTKTCKKCSYQCINCVGQATNCTLCNSNPGFYRINILPKCVCQDGYFDDNIQVICQKCSYQCKLCEFESDNCIECESEITRTSFPVCECKPGFYKNNSEQCLECSKKCLTCQDDPENCLICQQARSTKHCVCQDGYYEANQQLCQKCSNKCETCQYDQLNCLTCGDNRINAPNCLCQDAYFDDLINEDCQKCDQYCLKCDFNGCIDCAANRIKQGNTCVCPTGSISYIDNIWCSNCDVAVVFGQFSDDLTMIRYKFEYPINFNFPQKVEVQENCQFILQTGLQLLGDEPICSIEKDTLIIQLGIGSTVVTGNVIIFNSLYFQHIQCSKTLERIVRTQINGPINYLQPQLQLLFPSYPTSPCQEISMSIINQKITGQRYLILKWQIQDYQPTEIISANQFQFQTITFQTGSIPPNTSLVINLYFTNFLNQSNSIQAKIQTLESSSPQLQLQSLKQIIYSWIPIKLIAKYSFTDCFESSNKISTSQNVEILENVIKRHPQESKPLVYQLYKFSQTQMNILIQKRTLSPETNYTIQSYIGDTKSDVNLQIQKSPLIVQIYGGTRIQNYKKTLNLQVNARDPDYQDLWNIDNDIMVQLICTDMVSNKSCKDIYGKQIHFNTTYKQQLPPNMFNPFTVLKFKVICTKDQLLSSDSVYIIFLDEDFSILNVTYPQGYNMRDININEQLEFKIQNVSNMYETQNFRFGLVYNYELVFVEEMPNYIIKFAIWDKFAVFKSINQISVRFYSQNYFQISLCSYTFTINRPPQNSVILVNPYEGQALFTKFSIIIQHSTDKDTPLQYRFAYYLNQQQYNEDMLSGKQYNLRILQDFSNKQSFSGILESGDLILLLSIADSFGSITNHTQQIKVQSFYDQFQVNLTIDIDQCKTLVDGEFIDLYQKLIKSQELINLYGHNINTDCNKLISQELVLVRQQLKILLIQETDFILQSRITNILNQIFDLKLDNRRLQEESEQSLCLNSESLQITIGSQPPIDQSIQEQNETKEYIQQLYQKILEVIQQGQILFQDYESQRDFGDQATLNSLQQNKVLLKNFIPLLGQIYHQSYQSRSVIIELIRKLMDSFQNYLETDKQGITISSTIGMQIFKIGQLRFNKYIIQDIKTDTTDDDEAISLERFIQIVKYPTNAYAYTKNFTEQFKDGKYIIQLIDNASHYYEQSIIPIKSVMFDPVIYVDQNNNINKVEKIYKGKINYNMDVVSDCNEQSTSNITSQIYVCANYHNFIWKFDDCQVQYQQMKDRTQIICQCPYLNPITLMILNTTNYTKTYIDLKKKVEISQFIRIVYYGNIASLFIIILLISIVIFKRKTVIHIYNVIYQLDVLESEQEDYLTNKQQWSIKLFKSNIFSLHELTRIILLDYTYLPIAARILLSYLNINIALTLFHLFNVITQNFILSGFTSILGQILLQIFVKVLEGLFTGPKILQYFGYSITIIINIGLLTLNVLINKYLNIMIISSSQSILEEVIYQFTLIIIIYGPIEILLQYFKLKIGFQIYKEFKQDPFNPLLNFCYYFIQDEAILCIFRGAIIK